MCLIVYLLCLDDFKYLFVLNFMNVNEDRLILHFLFTKIFSSVNHKTNFSEFSIVNKIFLGGIKNKN
jgi:hypothetical protein